MGANNYIHISLPTTLTNLTNQVTLTYRAGGPGTARGWPLLTLRAALGSQGTPGFTLKGTGFSNPSCTYQDNYCMALPVRKALGCVGPPWVPLF